MFKKSIFVMAGLMVMPVLTMAQGTNSGATVTAPFLAVPPTVDGQVSSGEWDAAGVAPGQWSQHSDAQNEDPNFPTTVRVAYGLDGLYVLFECVDDEVIAGAGASEFLGSGPTGVPGQGQPFTFGGDTDYLAIYVDPSNYADDNPSSSSFSYSIQAEPGMTWENAPSSYTYTELGQFGGFAAKLSPPIENTDGNLQYWAGGVSWEAPDMVIKDGATATGYVMEFFFPWSTFSGYTTNWASQALDGVSDINADSTDPFNVENAVVPGFRFNEAGEAFAVGLGAVTGMPAAGTEWKVQFARYSQNAVPQYVNWVGDTGGFVSRPFGNLEFGTIAGSGPNSIQEAFLHSN